MLIDDYFGNDLTPGKYDALACEIIGAKLLQDESMLYSTKWFDYRHLHPTSATYLFAHHYVAEYRKIYQKIRDQEKGKFITGTKGKDVMLKKEVSGFWKARQSADRIGMPYNLYIGAVMRFLIEGNIWQRIPRPAHMYSSKVQEFIVEEWRAMLDTGIVEPSTAHLSDDNEFAEQCKQDIARWLCMQLKTRKNPHFGLAHYMLDKKIVPERIAIQYLSAETIDRAKKFHAE